MARQLLNGQLQLKVVTMRTPLLRRATLAALAVVLAGAAGCDPQSQGAPNVVVIGDEPRLPDPLRGPLDNSDAVLADNVAQGLVRLDAAGQVEPALAETWNVSDDGLSYIFRLANVEWANGRKVTAEQVARMLRRTIAQPNRDPLNDSLGAVDEIVAMTDRVIEIRLDQPRPHLLQLLAQPAMGFVNNGGGTGPFTIDREESGDEWLRLVREVPVPDEEDLREEEVLLSGAAVEQAVAAFATGAADLVLGGTFADLPFAQRADLSRGAIRFDPAAGLFGLVPATDEGLVGDTQVREVLGPAIDRQALVDALAVPGLVPRSTILEPGLDIGADPQPPEWAGTPLAERRPDLVAAADRLFEDEETPVIKVALPEGPGADILLDRLKQDWGALGIEVRRVDEGEAADLKLIDQVAPASSAAWYLRHFRCEVAPVCDSEFDELLAAARNTPVQAQRSALLTEASRRADSLQLFLPLAAPVRWSLVSPRITGFAGNRFAIHTLTGLEQPLQQTGQ